MLHCGSSSQEIYAHSDQARRPSEKEFTKGKPIVRKRHILIMGKGSVAFHAVTDTLNTRKKPCCELSVIWRCPKKVTIILVGSKCVLLNFQNVWSGGGFEYQNSLCFQLVEIMEQVWHRIILFWLPKVSILVSQF